MSAARPRLCAVVGLAVVGLRALCSKGATAASVEALPRRRNGTVAVHLVVPLFGGASAWESPPMLPLYVASASAAAGVALTIVGDAAPPYALPAGVRHELVSWRDLCGRLEAVAGRRFSDLPPSLDAAGLEGRAGWSTTRLNAISGYKPLLRLLYPEVFDERAPWIGWSDCDVLVGGGLGDLARAADAAGAQLIAPADDGPRAHNRKLSWGPLTLFRRDAFDASIAPALRAYLAARGTPAPRETFDEWGMKRWGGAGFEHSFSGILAPLVADGTLATFAQPLDPNAPPLFDACCSKSLQHMPQCKLLRDLAKSGTCGYCRFDRGRLFGPAGEDYFLCHFQFAKRGWPKGNATFLDALRLATRPTFTTPKHGAWFREGDR